MTIAKMQPAFIPNAGQADRGIHYYVKGATHGINFTEDGVVFAFLESTVNEQQPVNGYAVALRFLGANSGVKPEGRQEGSGKVNYLYGSDPAKWQTDLATYEEIVYRELWPHVDMVFRGGNGRLKYEFVVHPGARIEDIQLTYAGADSLSLDESGNLVITTPTGTLTDERPVAIQEKDGQQIEVESAFLIKQDEEGQQFGFVLGEGYDPQVPLVIDPGLIFSTFLGGENIDLPGGVAVDDEGHIYVTGNTYSTDFPTTEGTFDRTLNGSDDVFITKLNAIGSGLVYSTYIGGENREYAVGIAVDSEGNAYVAGNTNSADFPTTEGAYDRTLDGDFDGFILKLNAGGNSLIYSTFLGGTDSDSVTDIKIDSEGNAYVTGSTESADFPTTEGAYDRTFSGFNPFVTKLNATGSGLVYSTFIGNDNIANTTGIALDAARNVYVIGEIFTEEGEGEFQGQAFVEKLNAMGSELVYSKSFEAEGSTPSSITVDSEGNAYVAGSTVSSGFPTTEGAYDTTFNGVKDAFVTKLNATGTDFVYSTFLGGSGGVTQALGIAVDQEGNVYVTGSTASDNFPTTADAFERARIGLEDVFITKLNATGSALLYSSYLGGRGQDFGTAITIDGGSDVYVIGYTSSLDFPIRGEAFNRTYNGGEFDLFVTKWNMTTKATGADLSVAVADLPDPVPIGTLLTYTIQVRNNGPETATGVRLTNILPVYVTFVSASGNCSISEYVVTCEIGEISSGRTVTVSITVLPTRIAQLQSSAVVSGNEEDLIPENNSVVITTTVIAKTPREEILDLIGMVNSLVLAGWLTQLQAISLLNSLWVAVSQLDAGNVEGACSELEAFRQTVSSYEDNGILDLQTAGRLFSIAEGISVQLGCEC